MRIAFIGTRGVPATYSGFETFVEQLGVRLVDRGHNVTVYCRSHHYDHKRTTYRGMRLKYVRGVESKHLDTITHTLIACADSLFEHYDVVVMCISGNSPAACLPRLVGSKVVLNVDGSDWRRRKWGRLARSYIRVSEWLATRIPNATVTDSEVMRRYYLERFGVNTDCIAYGAEVPPAADEMILETLNLKPRGYLLLVGRLVPENCADHLADAYGHMKTDLKCVIVGDAPYANRYISQLKRTASGVIFPGYVFGDGYRSLMHNAFAVVLCSEVGGTHPVLVEAMAAGNCVVVNDTPANREVIQDSGETYSGIEGWRGLLVTLNRLLSNPGRVDELRTRAKEHAGKVYNWDSVTTAYEQIFQRITGDEYGADGNVATCPHQASTS